MALEDYDVRKKGQVCKACQLPAEIRAEMDAGYARGTRYAAIVRWLEGDHNITHITVPIVSGHYMRKHHHGNA